MARRVSKLEAAGLFYLLIIGIPAYGLVELVEAAGARNLLTVAIVVCVAAPLLYLAKRASDKAATARRRDELAKKYGDPKIADAILSRTVWKGQTVEQLQESLGRAADIDQKVLKSMTREVWKYHPRGANRFGLRITVENGVVSGWDEKL